MHKFGEKLAFSLAALLMLVFLCGKSKCQEDYEFGAQTEIPTETATPTATSEDDGGDDDDGIDDGVITATPTNSPTTSSGDATATPTVTPTTEGGVTAAEEILGDLALLSEAEEEESSTTGSGITKEEKSGAGQENWLGKAFTDQDQESQSAEDTDRDGFTNWLEDEAGTDPNDVRSVPLSAVRTSLRTRMQGVDRDLDGLPDDKEKALGTDPNFPDSDEDGFLDGIEVLAETDPMSDRNKPSDSDRDGIGDDLEAKLELDPRSRDTDLDGLRDDLEIIVGANPLSADSDNDGILDGREYELGSDPVVSERE